MICPGGELPPRPPPREAAHARQAEPERAQETGPAVERGRGSGPRARTPRSYDAGGRAWAAGSFAHRVQQPASRLEQACRPGGTGRRLPLRSRRGGRARPAHRGVRGERAGSGRTAPASPGHGRPLPRARPGSHPRAGTGSRPPTGTGGASTTSPAAPALSTSAPRASQRGRTGWSRTSVWRARAGRSSTTPAPMAFIWTAWRAAGDPLRDTVSRMERFTRQHRTRSQGRDRGPSEACRGRCRSYLGHRNPRCTGLRHDPALLILRPEPPCPDAPPQSLPPMVSTSRWWTPSTSEPSHPKLRLQTDPPQGRSGQTLTAR